MTIDVSVYLERRARLLASLGDGVAIIPTAPERLRNRDNHYVYRFDSSFYYLSGFSEPEAVLVLQGGPAPRSLLFCREKNPLREQWDGVRFGPEAAAAAFGFDDARPISALDAEMVALLSNRPRVYFALGADPVWDARLSGWLNAVRAEVRNGVTAPAQVHDIRSHLDEMRLFKDAHELALLRRAADISAAGHVRAGRILRPGITEYEIEAELLYEFRRLGADAPAYPPIVAAGANACILHYVENRAVLREGELLLIDAGAEWGGYAGDISRTFPVGGRFTAPQRDLYQLVLEAQAAAIAAVRPGNDWDAPHQAALRVLTQGFIDAGLCRGSLDAVLESGDYKRFYMHKTGHWLGLDVHDVGDYRQNGVWRRLEPGMTTSPGR